MPIDVPEQARCLKCGYRLRDLDEPVCPECARRFDPEDTATYNAHPSRRRTRRLILWTLSLLLIGGLGFALWPRKIMRAQISFNFQQSGYIVTIKRWEPMSPGWLPLRYPGYSKRTVTPGNARPTDDEPYTVSITAAFAMGSLSGSGTTLGGESVVVNGIVAHPDQGEEILKQMLAPDNTGISFSSMTIKTAPKTAGQ